MRRVAAILMMAAALCGAAFGESMEDFAKRLETELKGNQVKLRTSACGRELKFDAAGMLKQKAKPGPWTLCDSLMPKAVALKKGRIEIDGTRLGMKFTDRGQKETLVKYGEVKLSVEANDPRQLKQALE